MKLKMIIAVVALLTSSFAFATEIANYKFVIKGEKVGEYHSFDVTLSSDSILEVETVTTVGRAQFYYPEEGTKVVQNFAKKLTSFEMNLFKADVERLSNVKIKKRITPYRCMMVPSPDQGLNRLSLKRVYNRELDEYLGQMTVVHTNQGCWASEHIAPAHMGDEHLAITLKGKLRTISISLAADKL